MKRHLIFGSNGSIGEATFKNLSENSEAIRAPRNISELQNFILNFEYFDSIIWAQGTNTSDSISDFNLETFNQTMEVNTTYILSTLQTLLKNEKIKSGAQLVVVSSIWSSKSKPQKLSYSISKAATRGLVRSVAVDLGSKGISINAIAPGPIDSEMTNRNLTRNELERIISETPLKRLVTMQEVVKLISIVASGQLTGVTGQELTIDGGWTDSKLV